MRPLAALACIWACFATTNSLADDSAPPSFEIRDDAGKVLLNTDGIIYYEWTTHTLTLRPEAHAYLLRQVQEKRRSPSPFVVTVGGQTIYEGIFVSLASSQSYDKAVITPRYPLLSGEPPTNEIQIQLGYPTKEFFKGEDPRYDDRIRSALGAAKKLTVAGNAGATSKPKRLDILDSEGAILLADEDIRWYDWTTHTLTVRPKAYEKLVDLVRKNLVIPFVVAADGETIYEGAFTSSLSSQSIQKPVILPGEFTDEGRVQKNRLRIKLGYPGQIEGHRIEDPRSDDRVRQPMLQSDRLIENPADHTAWVVRSLRELQQLKPAMTRADLLEVCVPEGGLSTRTERRYAYCECPYIKVDVKFEPSSAGTDETSDDRITSISKPYLEWSIRD